MISCVILRKSPTFSEHLPSCISAIFNCFVLLFINKQLGFFCFLFFGFCFCFGQAGYLLQHKGSFIVACELSCPMTCGILVPGPEIKHLRPLQWKGGILTTGLSGKSQNFLLKKKKLREINFYLAYALFKNCLLCATGSVAWTSNSRLGH